MTQLQIEFNSDSRASQNAQILSALQRGQKLTPLDALNDFGCFRLGARVWDLVHGKFDGTEYPIKTEIVKTPTGKRIAQYRLDFGVVDGL